MVKNREPSKIILEGKEKAELEGLRKDSRIQKQRIEIFKRKSEINKGRRTLGASRFAQTRTARVGRILSNFPRQVSRGRLRVGRPRGSYDRRYASSGGVYGYRKLLSAQLREQRLQQIRENTLSPEQQQLLAQAQARQNAQRVAPENQIIPDTNGRFNLKNIHQEIEDAANIF